MRSLCAFVMLAAAVMMPAAVAADNDGTVAVRVRVSSRTSLHVSTNVLEFRVPAGTTSATAVVDFTAAVRLPSSSGVVLNVEPGLIGDTDAEITFAGTGEGMKSGRLIPSGDVVAASWEGSGQRRGRIVFTMHASTPGVYRVPIRLVLATP